MRPQVLHVAFLLLLALFNCALAQPSAQACIAGPQYCAIFQTILIQTSSVTNLTQITINVSNVCTNPVYYIQFSMASPYTAVTLVPQLSTSVQYVAHYTWTVSFASSTLTPSDSGPTSWLVFTPASGTPGVSGKPPVQTSMAVNSGTGWSWEIFSFQVAGYVDPTFPWYWQAHIGSNWDTFGPLDMSNCFCANCDAGYFQRLITACDTGYYNPVTNAYGDTSTPLSTSVFNENKVLYAFSISTDWLELFYSDEHALLMGYKQVSLNGVIINDVTNVIPPTPSTPTCIVPPALNFGNLNFNSSSAASNVDGNNIQNFCYGGPNCGRPMPPSLFITDTTVNGPTSRIGDWQFGGSPTMPHKICGTWKYAVKSVSSTKLNSDGSYDFGVTTDADPPSNLINGGTDWNLGAGSDPVPIPSIGQQNTVQPGASAGLGLDLYGAEIAWDLNQLNLNPSHSYRFLFTVHDGDQTKIGGDVGMACVGITPACPPGFAGPNCSACDLNPPPGNAWTWYCFPSGTSPPYNLLKIPLTKLTQSPFLNSGGFIPGLTPVDPAGYKIGCNCVRVTILCPDSCCANGVCDERNGVCNCTTLPPPGIDINTTTCCVGPTPPCFNNGSYCSAHGSCVNGTCACVNGTDGTSYVGPACNIVIPPPPPTCSTIPTNSCSDCTNTAQALNLTCMWCPQSNVTNTLTVGVCKDLCVGGFSACIPPATFVPPPCPDACSGHGSCVNQTVNVTNTNSTNSTNSTGNYTQVCICVGGYYGINCGDGGNSLTEIVAGSLGAGALAGIIVAAVLCAGAAGGGGYAVAARAGGGAMSVTSNNPMYVGNTAGGANPLFKPV